jgi:activating signal cointegrator 1
VLSTGLRKKFETRQWNTSHRGLLLIHAALRLSKEAYKLAAQEPFKTALRDDPFWSSKRGNIIGAVNLSRTHQIVEENRRLLLADSGPHEQAFGDWRNGRFAWWCPDAVRFTLPFYARGRQRFFDVSTRSVLLATEQWNECPDWWGETCGCPGCLCATCRSYGD